MRRVRYLAFCAHEPTVRTRRHCGHGVAGYVEGVMYPPSLSDLAQARAFRAANGELGVMLDDAPTFLAACRSDHVNVLGWELWIVDHRWDTDTNSPQAATGSWCGGIPIQGCDVLGVFAGEGDAGEVQRQLASLEVEAEIQHEWLPFVRVNFTLEN